MAINSKPYPLTCVLSGILGNRIMSARLSEAVDSLAHVDRHLWFDDKAYASHPAPYLFRKSSVIESLYIAKRWLHAQSIGGPVIVNSYVLALAGNWADVIVATDATPRLPTNPSAGPMKGFPRKYLDYKFRRLANSVSAWLPISETVKQSLVNDYGVPPERCFVTQCPQFIVDPRPHVPSGRLLFVGNDFTRKGGPELLQIFRQSRLPNHALTIVSNDLSIQDVPKGVEVVRGINEPSQISSIYHRSDLLVLPTHYDCYSLVICEAAAHGIPSLATRVGSIGELLDESGGISLPDSFSLDDIVNGIHKALDNEYEWRAKKAAKFAEDKLTMTRFISSVADAMQVLYRQ